MTSEKQIRKRKSYAMFKKISRKLKQGRHKEVLKLIHKSIDEMRGYGSEMHSGYAEQSMKLVINEEFNQRRSHV